jgi:hypothetical protein
MVRMWESPAARLMEEDIFLQAEDPATEIPKYENVFGVAKVERFEKGWRPEF